ncbi:MAG: stage II sporulation protein R [Herbinix sp.]|nr:stage II sporulation protein R [Herbinix sp.]
MKLYKKFYKSIVTFIVPNQSGGKDKHGIGQFNYLLLVLVLLFCGIAMWVVKANAIHNAEIQDTIAEDIIRFHVIANSDSTQDQALKLKVKDKLVESLSPILSNAASITEARTILSGKLDFIQEIAENTIQQYGYSYPVKVTLEDNYFPLKVYGSFTFPPGIYEALRVQIGAAEGKNWWCVMFPPLCFVDETYSVVDEESNEKLKHVLTEDEYDTLIHEKKPIKIKFKIWDSIKDLFN